MAAPGMESICHDSVENLSSASTHVIEDPFVQEAEEEEEEVNNWADFSGSFSESFNGSKDFKSDEEDSANWVNSVSDQATPTHSKVSELLEEVESSKYPLLSTSSDEFGDFDWQGPQTVSTGIEEDYLQKWKKLSSSILVDLREAESKELAVVPLSLHRTVGDSKLWNDVSQDLFSPRPGLWSHPHVTSEYHSAIGSICRRLTKSTDAPIPSSPTGGDLKCLNDGLSRLSVSLSEDFEWNSDDSGSFLGSLKELSLGNLSPESATISAYVRSNLVSPVEVEMDISRATAGLSTLSELELEEMVQEMQTKFSRMAETLVGELEKRERLIASRGVRNQFISAWHQLVQHQQNTSVSPGRRLSVKELKKWATMTKKTISEEKSPQKYMSTVIPYISRSANTSWDVETLKKLTRIVNAIFNNLDVVPALLREYITECMDLEDSMTY